MLHYFVSRIARWLCAAGWGRGAAVGTDWGGASSQLTLRRFSAGFAADPSRGACWGAARSQLSRVLRWGLSRDCAGRGGAFF